MLVRKQSRYWSSGQLPRATERRRELLSYALAQVLERLLVRRLGQADNVEKRRQMSISLQRGRRSIDEAHRIVRSCRQGSEYTQLLLKASHGLLGAVGSETSAVEGREAVRRCSRTGCAPAATDATARFGAIAVPASDPRRCLRPHSGCPVDVSAEPV